MMDLLVVLNLLFSVNLLEIIMSVLLLPEIKSTLIMSWPIERKGEKETLRSLKIKIKLHFCNPSLYAIKKIKNYPKTLGILYSFLVGVDSNNESKTKQVIHSYQTGHFEFRHNNCKNSINGEKCFFIKKVRQIFGLKNRENTTAILYCFTTSI